MFIKSKEFDSSNKCDKTNLVEKIEDNYYLFGARIIDYTDRVKNLLNNLKDEKINVERITYLYRGDKNYLSINIEESFWYKIRTQIITIKENRDRLTKLKLNDEDLAIIDLMNLNFDRDITIDYPLNLQYILVSDSLITRYEFEFLVNKIETSLNKIYKEINIYSVSNNIPFILRRAYSVEEDQREFGGGSSPRIIECLSTQVICLECSTDIYESLNSRDKLIGVTKDGVEVFKVTNKSKFVTDSLPVGCVFAKIHNNYSSIRSINHLNKYKIGVCREDFIKDEKLICKFYKDFNNATILDAMIYYDLNQLINEFKVNALFKEFCVNVLNILQNSYCLEYLENIDSFCLETLYNEQSDNEELTIIYYILENLYSMLKRETNDNGYIDSRLINIIPESALAYDTDRYKIILIRFIESGIEEYMWMPNKGDFGVMNTDREISAFNTVLNKCENAIVVKSGIISVRDIPKYSVIFRPNTGVIII